MATPFRQAMARLHAVKQTLDTASKEPEGHAETSACQRDAAISLLQGKAWTAEQIRTMADTIAQVKWHGADGFQVAALLSPKVGNNSGRVQNYESVLNYFRQYEWEQTLSRHPDAAQLLMFTRIMDLGGHKLTEGCWRTISMALTMMRETGERLAMLSINEKFTQTDNFKKEFKRLWRRRSKLNDVTRMLDCMDLPTQPSELKFSNPEIYADVFPEGTPGPAPLSAVWQAACRFEHAHDSAFV